MTSRFYNRALLLPEEKANIIHEVLQAKIHGADVSFNKIQQDEEAYLERNTIDEKPDANGISHINIYGTLGKRLSSIDAMSGMCDIDVLREQIDSALSYPDTKAMLFCVDSNGGDSQGVPELAEYIAELNKNTVPIYTLVEGACCSGAYYLIAGTSEIYATRFSQIGSIGAFAYLIDSSRAMENAGLKPIVIRSDDTKAEILPGLPISTEAQDRIREDITYVADTFKTFVGTYRDIDFDKIKARSFLAERALENNLIDGVISSADEIFSNNPLYDNAEDY